MGPEDREAPCYRQDYFASRGGHAAKRMQKAGHFGRGVVDLPKDLIIVVDYSGSMSGGKMARARKGCHGVVNEQLHANDNAALVIFNGFVEIRSNLVKKGPQLSSAIEA